MSDVILSVDPWVDGTRARGYWGPVVLERIISGPSWEEAIEAILEEAAQLARDQSCNAVVNIEIKCDPYYRHGGEPCGHLQLQGTIADLEPLFAGINVVYP